MKILGVIPARGGSKGIPQKNKKLLCGKPLIIYTIEAAKKSALTKIVVSTDDQEIRDIALRAGVDVLMRPENLANDNTPTLPVIQHVINEINWQGEFVMILQPTSPLRTFKHINKAIKIMCNVPEADSLVSVMRVPHPFTPNSLMRIEGSYLEYVINETPPILRRQDKPVFWARNGAAIYLSKKGVFKNSILGDKILPLEMSKIDSIDIDDMEDWKLCEIIISHNNLTDKSGLADHENI